VAHMHILKTVIVGLENWAIDCVSLGQFLDLRTQTGIPNVPPSTFGPGALYVEPMPGTYGPGTNNTRDALLAAAAVKLDSVVSLNQSTLSSTLHGVPAPQQPAQTGVSDDDLWRLVVNWQALVSHFFKAALKMYGQEPGPHPTLGHPGPGREERHLALVLSRLTKIEADASRLRTLHNIAAMAPYAGPAGGGTYHDSLVRFEMGFHKMALDVAQIATLLPNHLLNATI
jgi:hypothetical protein